MSSRTNSRRLRTARNGRILRRLPQGRRRLRATASSSSRLGLTHPGIVRARDRPSGCGRRAARRTRRRRAREHDHRPRAAAAGQPARGARDRGGGARGGAVPATIAIVGGEVRVGLDDAALDALATRDGVAKCGVRDLAPVVARARLRRRRPWPRPSHLAARAGIRVFATGGLGGVHRGAARPSTSRPTSRRWRARDLRGVRGREVDPRHPGDARAPGDPERHRARLPDRPFPAFYLTSSGIPVTWRVDTPAEAAAVLRARLAVGAPGAVVVANPLPTSRSTPTCTSACCATASRRPPRRA